MVLTNNYRTIYNLNVYSKGIYIDKYTSHGKISLHRTHKNFISITPYGNGGRNFIIDK